MQRAQVKMLREYFSGVPFENLTRRYGYSEKKIKDKIAALEDALKLANIKAEGCEVDFSAMTH